MAAAVANIWKRQTCYSFKTVCQMISQYLTTPVLTFQGFQLHKTERRLKFCHAIVPTQQFATVSSMLQRVGDCLSVVSNKLCNFCNALILSDQHSSFTGHKILAFLKGEDTTNSKGPDFSSPIGGSWRLGAVFDDRQVMSF